MNAYVVQDGDDFLVVLPAVRGQRRLPQVWARCDTEYAARVTARALNGTNNHHPAPKSGAGETEEALR